MDVDARGPRVLGRSRGRVAEIGRTCGGATVIEVAVAVVLALFIGQASLASLARLRSLEAATEPRVREMVFGRAVRSTLREELRAGVQGRDWAAGPPDSIRLRAFRGYFEVCPGTATDSILTVFFSGERAPDPLKDSVLIVDDEGGWQAVNLVGVSSVAAPCLHDGSRPYEAWRVTLGAAGTVAPAGGAAPSPVGPVGRVIPVVFGQLFESGSYHLGDALRYRRGRSGRQPLTDVAPRPLGLHREGAALRLVGGVPWLDGGDLFLAGPSR